MALPAPNLDDLRFQADLVDEARLRIIRYCPEWTEYNLSDPGITLIELFAWMTEQIVYRLNKVPDKNYIKFLEMLGVHLQAANSARAELTFRLSAFLPFEPGDDTAAIVPQGIEVATRTTPDAEEVIFTTDKAVEIVPPLLSQIRREAEFHKNYVERMERGIELLYAFGGGPNQDFPQLGETFYLGFDVENDLIGHILQLSVQCERTEAVGIRRDDPPLVWECSGGNGTWIEILPSTLEGEEDTTGGLNNESGYIVFYLPLELLPDQVYGRNAFWIRCRHEQRHADQRVYTRSPRIKRIDAYTMGATTTATNAIYVYYEDLGVSDGDPGQTFQLVNFPVLDFDAEEAVEVEEWYDGEYAFIPWQRVEDFSRSSRHDRHYTLDTATGEIRFGPSVRQPDGTTFQYGKVPEVRRQIRVNRYRFGGGVQGNVPIGQIEIMRSAVPYIDRVSNMRRSNGGRDQETLNEAMERARRELRAQHRAVTADDYENLAIRASREVARVMCHTTPDSPQVQPGVVDLLIVPTAFDSIQVGDYSKLTLDLHLAKVVREYLDEYRLLTTSLQIREPRYIGVQVQAHIVPGEYARPDVVVGRVNETLRQFITPLPMPVTDTMPKGIIEEDWQGWPLGRSLYTAELFSVIQQVPGVKHVLDVDMHYRPLVPSREIPPLGQIDELDSDLSDGTNGNDASTQDSEELQTVTDRVLHIPTDTLLCSLAHDIELVTL
ncbi:MAG: putative baseplate assembly protein [Chloroflexota bacterium]